MVPTATATDVLMPRLSDSMEDGTIARWLKSVGETVERGEELVEIDSDKATVIYEAEAAGTLLAIVADAGVVVPIGGVIARIGEPGAAIDPPAHPAPDAPPAPPPTREGRVVASPVARRLAAKHDVDLAVVRGSGPNGRITRADVERARADGTVASSAPAHPAAAPAAGRTAIDASAAPAIATTARGTVTVLEPTSLQRTVALRMAQSKATAPDFSLECEVDMSRTVAARERLKESAAEEAVPSFNDIVVKAVAMALRRFPNANAAFINDRFELYSRVNVGVAVAAEHALVVPTIFDADEKTLSQIAHESRRLAEAVRAGRIAPADLDGGTFTVSNLGMFGISAFHPVINPPQAGIVAVGAIEERPVVRAGELAVAPLMRLTLTCDHRVLYGAGAARLLGFVRALLEEPLRFVH